jgi:hypothetical protein
LTGGGEAAGRAAILNRRLRHTEKGAAAPKRIGGGLSKKARDKRRLRDQHGRGSGDEKGASFNVRRAASEIDEMNAKHLNASGTNAPVSALATREAEHAMVN